MVWKPKEKELTPDEAVALARKELAPFWIGSAPLLAAVRAESGGVSVFPLDPQFAKRARLLFFVDPTDFAIFQIAHFAREWNHRYSAHGFQVLIVVESRYTELRIPATVTRQLRRFSVPLAVIDQDGLFSLAFGAHDLPFVALLHHKDVVFSYSARDWIARTELSIQQHLRATDPGLPLPPPYRPERKLILAKGELDLGRGRSAEFPAPGFRLAQNGLGAAVFGENLAAAPRPGSARVFSISGAWAQDPDRIMTSDPAAGLTFQAPGREVAVVARALTDAHVAGRIAVEVNGAPAVDMFCGSDLVMDDEGRSSAQVTLPGTYYLLTALDPEARRVTLRFPQADRAPVALYGLRFGD